MKAAILGYGKSGKTSLALLKKLGYSQVDIYDDNISLGYKSIASFKDEYETVSIAPGLDISKLSVKPTNITSELELAFNFMKKTAKVIAITGTNGKSTTTFLTAQILNNIGIKAVACGNIGVTFGDMVFDESIDIFVIELSSFQIDLLQNFNVDAGCIINLTPDHLDRYKSLEHYYSSKVRLANFIKADGLFLYPDITLINNSVKNKKFAKIIIDEKLISYPKLDEKILDFKSFHLKINEFKLLGRHNIVNLAYAVLLASNFYKFIGDISKYISNLQGMHHRTELVLTYNNIRYINDSKATNVDSVLTALQSAKKPTTLLLGGRDKKSDYRLLVDLINKNISRIIYFGEASELIKNQIDKLIDIEKVTADTMKNAVEYVVKNPVENDTVLLSPACTSFDEFNNYEERGRRFLEYIKNSLGIKI